MLLISVGAAIRVLQFAEWKHDPLKNVLIADEQWYWDSASSIANGESPTGTEPFYYGPLYSYALAPLIALGADHAAVVVVQHVLGLIIAVLVFLIGYRVFGQWEALIAAGLIVVLPVVVYYESLLLMETFLSLILVGALFLLLTVVPRSRYSSLRVVAAGLLLGMAATGRPALIVLAVLSGWWLRRQSTPGAAMLLFLVVGSVVLVPVVRNLIVSKQLTFITTSGGMNLYLGNAPTASGTTHDVSLLESKFTVGGRSYAQGKTGRQLSATQTSNFWMNQTLAFLKAHPERVCALLIRKTALLITNEDLPQIEWFEGDRRRFPALRILSIPLFLIFALSAAGAMRARQSSLGLLLLLFAVIIPGILIPFFVTTRFRISWLPFLCILDGAGLLYMIRIAAALHPKAIGTALIPPMLVCGISLFQPRLLNHIQLESMYKTRQAYKLSEAGLHDQAIQEIRGAISLEPRNYLAYAALGSEYTTEHDWPSARRAYQSTLDITPRYAEALYGLAITLYHLGKPALALERLNDAWNIWTFDARIAEYRGIVLDALNHFPEADSAFQQAITLDPTRPKAQLNYATFLSRRGKLTSAIRHYEAALALDPKSTLTRRNLALAFFQTRQFQDAKDMALTLPKSDSAKSAILTALDSLGVDVRK